MTTAVKQIKLEAKLFLRGRQNLFQTLAFPAIMILIFGTVFNKQTWSGVPAINYLLPGIIVMATVMACMNNNLIKVTNEREKGVYRRLSLTPLKRQTILIGNVAVRYLIVLASTALLVALGVAVFNAHFGGNFILFWSVLTIGALVFVSLGFVLTSLVKSTNSAMTLGMAVLFPMMFLGGCFWPADVMPSFLQTACQALPTTHLNMALRMIVVQNAGFGQVWHELPVMLGWLVGCSVLAVRLFKWE
jgi:ABC-2 type transport system permease protein